MNDQSHQIPAQLQTGRDVGMQLMDMALLEAIQAKQIDPDDAFRFANDKRKFSRFVTDTSLVPVLEGDARASFEVLESDGTLDR
jgi:twitching motility protein PilT